MTVLPVDVICDDDATGTVQGYFTCQKQPGERGPVYGESAGKRMRGGLSYRAGQGLYTTVSGGRQCFRCAGIPHGKIVLGGKMFGCGNDGGRMVYIMTLRIADCIRDFGDRRCTGTDTPEEQGQYVNET